MKLRNVFAAALCSLVVPPCLGAEPFQGACGQPVRIALGPAGTKHLIYVGSTERTYRFCPAVAPLRMKVFADNALAYELNSPQIGLVHCADISGKRIEAEGAGGEIFYSAICF